MVVRDRRRVDPSGALRDPDPAAVAGSGADGTGPDEMGAAEDARVAELTDTLQRVKAEYDNYRRRAERDRLAAHEAATAQVLAQLLPVVDDIERARGFGDLTGAFGAVAEALITVVTKLGLESYGEAGEEFNPQVHEAVLQHPPAEGTLVPVASEVFRPGYRYAGRVLRAAQVAVADPVIAAEPLHETPDETDR